MASNINVGSAFYDITVNSAGFKKGINDADEAMTLFNQKADVIFNEVNIKSQETSKNVQNFGKVFKTAVALLGTGQVFKLADTFTNLNNKLKLVTDSTEELVKTRTDLLALANDTRSDAESTIELYAKLARSTKELNVSNEDLQSVTKGINQAFKISGASAQEASNATRQLAQGLSAGALRGDEFVSVMEQGDRVAQAIADSLGVTKGQLRDLASEGKITSKVIIDAFKGQSETLQNEFDQLTPTIGGGLQLIKNAFLEIIGTGDQVTEASKAIFELLAAGADVIKFLAQNIDLVIVAIKTLIALKLTNTLVSWTQNFLKAAAASGTYAAGAGAATNATTLLRGGMSKLFAVIKANPIGLLIGAFTALISLAQKAKNEFDALTAKQKEAFSESRITSAKEAIDAYNQSLLQAGSPETALRFGQVKAQLDGIGISIIEVTEAQKQNLLDAVSGNAILEKLYGDRIRALRIIKEEQKEVGTTAKDIKFPRIKTPRINLKKTKDDTLPSRCQ